MRPPLRLTAVLVVLLLTTTACALSSDGPDATSTPAPAATTSDPSATGGTASDAPSPAASAALPDDLRTRPTVVAAIADTAAREDVTPDEVVIAAWSPVTWTDGSLGCPRKDMSYTQALVEGELLILRVGAGLFQYHARSGGSFAYCASPSSGYSVGG